MTKKKSDIPEKDFFEPIFLPEDVYDKICVEIKEDEIRLLGLS